MLPSAQATSRVTAVHPDSGKNNVSNDAYVFMFTLVFPRFCVASPVLDSIQLPANLFMNVGLSGAISRGIDMTFMHNAIGPFVLFMLHE